jgi:hypothetical protein
MTSLLSSLLPRAVERPLPLILIALFQLSKAVFFLMVASLLVMDPTNSKFSPLHLPWFVAFVSADGSAMIPIATDLLHGHNPSHLSLPVVAAVLAFFGFWLVYISWGLMQLKAWARRTRVVVSAIQVLSGLTVLLAYLPWLRGIHAPLSSAQWRDLFVLVWLNSAVIFYLVRDVDVARAFDSKSSKQT